MSNTERDDSCHDLQQNQIAFRPRKRWVFRLAAIMFPVVVLLLVECLLRWSGGRTDRDPYINVSPFTIFSRVKIDGRDHYRITHRYAYAERNVHFPIEKPARTIRLFCIGGSACASWPHPVTETFSRYLEQALGNAFPHNQVEVINAATHGFASYRVRHVLDDIVDLSPDAVIIYSGNNEFLEKRQYNTSLVGLADQLGKNLRTVGWLVSRLRGEQAELAGDELNEVATFFFKKIQRESLELRSEPEQFQQVVQHYRESIRYMVQQASRRDIAVLLLTLPVNLRDWLPTVSHNRHEGSQRDNWGKLYRQARKHLLARQFDDGVQIMSDAIEIEPDHAESYFWLGRMQEAAGNMTEALESYRRAKDLDYNPFRAHSLFNKALREIAQQYPHVTLVDLAKAFPSASLSGLPGYDLFLDYVHPNKQGNLLIAQQVFGALVQQDIGRGKAATSDFIRTDEPVADTGMPYDELTHLQLQKRLFNLYAQNHQYNAAVRNAIRLHQLVTGKDEEPEKLDPQLPKNMREGYQAFRRYLDWQRKDFLGQLQTDDEKQQAEDQRRQFFEKWYPYGTF